MLDLIPQDEHFNLKFMCSSLIMRQVKSQQKAFSACCTFSFPFGLSPTETPGADERLSTEGLLERVKTEQITLRHCCQFSELNMQSNL